MYFASKQTSASARDYFSRKCIRTYSLLSLLPVEQSIVFCKTKTYLMMIGACSLSEVKTKMHFLHPIIPKTKLQKNEKNNLQERERSNVFQNPAT